MGIVHTNRFAIVYFFECVFLPIMENRCVFFFFEEREQLLFAQLSGMNASARELVKSTN